ncbi:MAG: HepT-like ribonuclease domain-containing protein [Sedimentisphaerales bacterium]
MKDDKLYLIHIIECIEHIESYTENVDKETFINTPIIQDAVIRNLQTMAESTQRLSERTKQMQPGIDWHRISGFRNVLVHDYLGVDLERIWNIVEKEITPLKNAIQAMMK